MEVILNKTKDTNKNTKIGDNGMMIKVYRIKNVEKENQKNHHFDIIAKNSNKYSLILHPRLKYLTKIINNHSPAKNSR